MERAVNIADVRAIAKRRLPQVVFDSTAVPTPNGPYARTPSSAGRHPCALSDLQFLVRPNVPRMSFRKLFASKAVLAANSRHCPKCRPEHHLLIRIAF